MQIITRDEDGVIIMTCSTEMAKVLFLSRVRKSVTQFVNNNKEVKAVFSKTFTFNDLATFSKDSRLINILAMNYIFGFTAVSVKENIGGFDSQTNLLNS